MLSFLHFGIIDILDILLVAYLFYQFYQLIINTVAEKIFYVIIGVYFIWVLVKAFHFELLSTILGHIMGVGVIAVLIVFQQEVRRFLLILGAKSVENLNLSTLKSHFFRKNKKAECKIPIDEILISVEYLKERKIGALIVLSETNNLDDFYESGQLLESNVKSSLIGTIFFKNTPLHDGAMFIVKDKIKAAGCVLPLTKRTNLPYYLGLRHRAAIGITEITETFAIIVSEERGQVSYSEFGKIYIGTDIKTIRKKIEKRFFKD